MVKKLVYAFAFVAFTVCGTAKGQLVGTGDNNAQELDSLRHAVGVLSAQVSDVENSNLDKKIWKGRSKYFNIGFVKQSLTSKDDGVKYKSKGGVNLTWGKTFYFPKKPIWNMVKFGIDLSWLDFNYAQYSSVEEKYTEGNYGYDEDFDIGCHQFEYGLQLGPSITVNPVQELKVSTYFRFQPSVSLLLLDSDLYYGFVPFFNFGASVSWKMISLGVEGRWGGTKYHGASLDDEEGDDDDENTAFVQTFSQRMRTKSFRVYLGLRF